MLHPVESHGTRREILHVAFFVPRGAPSDVIKKGIRACLETIHTLLGLAKNQALILQVRPLLGKYHAPTSCHTLSFFPNDSKGAAPIVQPRSPWSDPNRQFCSIIQISVTMDIFLFAGKIEQ